MHLEILKAARELLSDPTNWRKGRYGTRTPSGALEGPYCIIGALAEGQRRVGGTKVSVKAIENDAPLMGLLFSCLPEPFNHVVNFNDVPETTHEDVLKVLDCSIKKLENPS